MNKKELLLIRAGAMVLAVALACFKGSTAGQAKANANMIAAYIEKGE